MMQGSTLEKGRKQERGKGNDDGREKEKDRKGRDHPPCIYRRTISVVLSPLSAVGG